MARPETIARLSEVYGHDPANPDAVFLRLCETRDRIAERVEGWQREEAEKREALAWCRVNGSPHLSETPAIVGDSE